LVLLCGFLLGAPPANAESKEAKAALKALEAGADDVVDVLAAQVDAHLALLGVEFDTVESNLKAGNDTFEAIRVFQALEEFQVAIADVLFDAASEFGSVQKEALEEWIAAGNTLGNRPKGFDASEKGPVRDFVSDVEKTLAKRYAKIDKRLKKIGDLFADDFDTHFSWHVEPPPVWMVSLTNGSIVKHFNYTTNTVDVIIATSKLSVANDARIQAGGRAGLGAEYRLHLDSANSGATFFGYVPGADNRWKYAWAGFSEQNFVVRIMGDPGQWAVTRFISVR
jgi:hypothetical protein